MVRVTVYRIFRGSMPFISAWSPGADKRHRASVRSKSLTDEFSILSYSWRGKRICFIRNEHPVVDVGFSQEKKRVGDEWNAAGNWIYRQVV